MRVSSEASNTTSRRPPQVLPKVHTPVATNRAAAADGELTVLINTFRREDLLRAAVRHYSRCSVVQRIHVNWAESPAPPDLTADVCCGKPLTFATPGVTHNDTSLNTRFLPVPRALPSRPLTHQACWCVLQCTKCRPRSAAMDCIADSVVSVPPGTAAVRPYGWTSHGAWLQSWQRRQC